MISHYAIIVTGQVQKIGFRFKVNLEAIRHNLRGFVRNEADGSVYIEAEGEEADLLHFIELYRQGGKESHIEKIDVRKGPVAGYPEFVIKH